MVSGFTDGAIASLVFTTLYLRDRGMDADPEDIEMGRHSFDLRRPALLFHNMFNDQIVSRIGKGGNRSMKAIEEPVALVPRVEISNLLSVGPKARVCKLVRCKIAERFG